MVNGAAVDHRAAPYPRWVQSALPWGGPGAARPIAQASAFTAATLFGASAAAQDFTPLDQFVVVPIPLGVDLEPRTSNAYYRDLTYDKRQVSRASLSDLSRAICQNEEFTFEKLEQPWFQWFRGIAPARITC